MLPDGYHWQPAGSWWQLLNPSGRIAAQIQPISGRFYITVGIDGYAHEVKKGSTASLERAKLHVERWAGERAIKRPPT